MPSFSLYRACLMVLSLCLKVGVMGKLRRLKTPDSRLLPIYPYLSNPELSFLTHSQKSRFAVATSSAHILLILCARHITKVGYSVVARVAINVVSVPAWPDFINVKPRKPVGAVKLHFNSNKNVPVVPDAAGNRPRLPPRFLSCYAACKHASLWVVVKQFAQARCGKIGLSHDTVPSLIGQRPACVDSTGGPRHFTTQACSGAPGITKHFYKAKASLAGFFTPFFLNPLGALTPFNAL